MSATAREAIEAAAAENGWTREPTSYEWSIRYVRSDFRVIVTYTRAGTVRDWEHLQGRVCIGFGHVLHSGKRADVLALLSAPADQHDPCARCGSPKSSNRHQSAAGHEFEARVEEVVVMSPKPNTQVVKTSARDYDVRVNGASIGRVQVDEVLLHRAYGPDDAPIGDEVVLGLRSAALRVHDAHAGRPDALTELRARQHKIAVEEAGDEEEDADVETLTIDSVDAQPGDKIVALGFERPDPAPVVAEAAAPIYGEHGPIGVRLQGSRSTVEFLAVEVYPRITVER